MCDQSSLDTYATEQYDPLCSHARGHEFLLDLSGTACRPCSAPEMRSRMRLPSCAPSFCFSKPVWLPRIITSCPKTAKAPRLHETRARGEAGLPRADLPGRGADPPPNRGTVIGAWHAAQQPAHRSGPRAPFGAPLLRPPRLPFAAVIPSSKKLEKAGPDETVETGLSLGT